MRKPPREPPHTLLKHRDQRLGLLARADTLDETAIVLLRGEEDAVDEVAVVFDDGDEGDLVVAAPARAAQGEVAFLVGGEGEASENGRELFDEVVL